MTSRTAVKAFFDPHTGTVSYVVSDNATACAAIVDPVLDFDMSATPNKQRGTAPDAAPYSFSRAK